jgi:hypothetical protein
LDRLITIELGHFDRESEIRIAMAKSGIPRVDAATIVDVVRESRGYGVNHHWPTVRVCIAIAKILAHKGARARLDNPVFIWTCRDVLNLDTAKVTRDGQSLTGKKVEEAIRAVCTSRAAKRAQE